MQIQRLQTESPPFESHDSLRRGDAWLYEKLKAQYIYGKLQGIWLQNLES